MLLTVIELIFDIYRNIDTKHILPINVHVPDYWFSSMVLIEYS